MPQPVLDVRGLQKHFPIRQGLLSRVTGHVRAVDDVSFAIDAGETLSLVGESGCGKTTTSRCILRAIEPTGGEIVFQGVDVAGLDAKALRPLRRQMQMIFQDPFSSLNPRMTISEIIGEPLLVNGMTDTAERNRRVAELLELVQLPSAYLNRFPHAFSGGQRQRIGIARALALNPSLVVADEPVSALDVSVQAQIVNLMLDLQDRLGLAYLFVAHDLSVVKHVSHRVAVMYAGRIVEVAPTAALFAAPRHPYTEALLSAVPVPDPRRRAQRIVLEGDVADPSRLPAGCAFHPRCRYATDACRVETPALTEVAPGQSVRCLRAGELSLRGV
jgi:ABC-type dipeptide/oligopeptide/nickel transport system ATPase component